MNKTRHEYQKNKEAIGLYSISEGKLIDEINDVTNIANELRINVISIEVDPRNTFPSLEQNAGSDLIDLVLDIEKYPEFVPWCIEGKIYERNESADLITFNGDLKVGKSILNETFSSHVSYYKEKDTIIVTNLDGPLKHLKNEWKFKEVNNSTQLEFFIDFELKNPILNGIMKKSFELGLNKIAKAFEERAIKLYK